MPEPRVNQQSAVDTWYQRLYKDLEVGYHDTLAWSLVMMGRADAQLSRPAYRTFFDRYKDELLKAILTMIANKDDELRYTEREQNEMMIGMRKLGLDWPELDVIERSLNASKAIKESVDLNTASEAVQLAAVRRNGFAIKHIKNPSEAVQLAAVKNSGDVIIYINKPSEAVQIAAVKKMLKNPGHGLVFAIALIKNPSDAVQLALVEKDVSVIQYIKNPSEVVQLAVVKRDGFAIKYINDPSEAVQLAAVKEHGAAIQYIKTPSYAIQLAAVKRNGIAIIFIKGPIKKLLDDPEAKHAIISTMLRSIRDDDAYDCKHMVQRLRRSKCTWPELDAIVRSLRASKVIKESKSEHDEYLDQLMRHLKSYLLDKQYGETFEIIQEIASMDDVPHDLKPLLDRNKDGIIRRMLEFIKHTTAGRYISPSIAGFDALTTLDGLRRLGVDWPELNAIGKSVKANRPIDEAMSNAFVSKMANLFYGDNPMAYREFDRKLKTRNPHDRQALLFAVKPAIIRWMLRMMRDGAGWAASDFMGMLTAQGVDWPELDTIWKSIRADSKRIEEDDEEWPYDDEPPRHILDRMQGRLNDAVDQLHNAAAEGESYSAWKMLAKIHDMIDSSSWLDSINLNDEGVDLSPVKDGILKGLLKLIRDGKLEQAKSVERLIGTDWPEMDIIRKSLKSTNRLRESDSIHPIVSMVADKIKTAIDQGNDHGPGYDIQVLSRVDPKKVYDGFQRIAPDLVKWFDRLAKSSPSFALDSLLHISHYTADLHPELLKALADHKEDVIRVLLIDLRRGSRDRHVLETVKYLSDQGLRWHELDVIRKSIDASKPKQLGG